MSTKYELNVHLTSTSFKSQAKPTIFFLAVLAEAVLGSVDVEKVDLWEENNVFFISVVKLFQVSLSKMNSLLEWPVRHKWMKKSGEKSLI